MRTTTAIVFGLILAGGNIAWSQNAIDTPPPKSQIKFRYHRLGNTGVQGDWSEAIFVGPNGDPWIGGYDPLFEEGGISKLIQPENRFVNLSNIDYKILGHPNDTGTVRARDIVADKQGVIWFPTWKAVFSYNPAVGASSLKRHDLDGPGEGGGGYDAEVAPDGSVWVASGNGVSRFSSATGTWTHFNDVPAFRLAIQPNPEGGYYVWAELHEGSGGYLSRYDNITGVWTEMPANGGRGRIYILQKKDAVDDAGNVWAYDIGDDIFNDFLTMGYLQPNGDWVEVPTPWPLGEPNECAAFKAYGNGLAVCATSAGTVFRWDGKAWINYGVGGGDASATKAIDIDVATGTVWTAGAGGAAKRDPLTGEWQRYRITNCSQADNFVLDLSITPKGEVWTTANIGTGTGGFQHFDGSNWRGFNQSNHGLPGSGPFPFPADNTQAIAYRPSNGHVALGMPGGGVQEWNGSEYTDLGLRDWYPTRLLEDSAGRLWASGSGGIIGVLSNGEWQLLNETLFADSPVRDPELKGWVWLSGLDGSVFTDGTTIEKIGLPDIARVSAPIGHKRAWVGGTGLYLVNMKNKTYDYFAPGSFSGSNPLPFVVSPDGLLWYGCDEGLGWLDTKNLNNSSNKNNKRGRSGIFHSPANGEPQWGGLPWAPQRVEIHVTKGYYELWMTTPSRGLTVLRVSSGRD